MGTCARVLFITTTPDRRAPGGPPDSAEGNGYIAPPPCLPVSSSPASLHLPTTRRRLSCLIDGEVVCCDERALTIFKVLCSLRYQPASHGVNVAFAARL
jgi:hypothetical protein